MTLLRQFQTKDLIIAEITFDMTAGRESTWSTSKLPPVPKPIWQNLVKAGETVAGIMYDMLKSITCGGISQIVTQFLGVDYRGAVFWISILVHCCVR